MKTFERYAEREYVIDPYASVDEPAARIRGPGRRRALSDLGILEISPFYAEHVNLTPRFTHGFTHGDLSLANIFISHPSADHAEGLAEMLQQLEAARTNIDPYVGIGQYFRSLIAGSFKEQLFTSVEEISKRSHPQNTVEHKKRLTEFLQPVMQLEKGGHVDAALDVLYDRMDALLKAKQFTVMDALLKEANVDSISVDVLLGLLTASLPARSKLPARSSFYAEAEASIKRRGEWEDGLLAGLES